MEGYLRSQMRCNTAALARAVIAEGIANFEDFLDFDEKGITSLCNSIRKPGGTVRAGRASNAPEIPDPGMHVPAVVDTRLKWAIFAAKYYTMIRRPMNNDVMAWSHIKHFNILKEMIDNHNNPETMPKVSKYLPIGKFLEMFEEQMNSILGIRKVPLAYVLREEVESPDITGEPLGEGDNSMPHSINYDGFYEELIARFSHDDPAFRIDNKTVFNHLNNGLAGTIYQSSMKPFSRNKNGRAAIIALKLHHMGSARWQQLVEESDKKLNRYEWNGKSQRFTLTKHINTHRMAHNDILRAAENIRVSIPPEEQRVTRLLNSLKSTDPRIISVKTQVYADPNGLGVDFEQVADLLMRSAPQEDKTTLHHRISAIKGKELNRLSSRGKSGVEFRYYKRAEYNRLTKEQKAELYEWKNSMNNANNKFVAKRKSNENVIENKPHKIAILESKLNELKEMNQGLQEKLDTITQIKSNRNHNALKKPGLTQRE